MRAYLRVFSLFALITSCVFSEEKGGYIGIDVGSSYTEFTQDVQPIGKILASNNLPGFMLKAGYKTFFGESKKYGMRWYLYGGYSYGKMQDVKADAFRRLFGGAQQPQIRPRITHGNARIAKCPGSGSLPGLKSKLPASYRKVKNWFALIPAAPDAPRK